MPAGTLPDGQRHWHGAETTGTVFLAFHLGKEATDIGGGVVAVAISVHGAAEARQRRPFCLAL